HPHAALAIRETQDRDLVPGSAPSAGSEQLQHGRRPISERGLGNEGLGRVVIGTTDVDGPVALQAGDKRRKLVEPLGGTANDGLFSHDGGAAAHTPQPRVEPAVAGGRGQRSWRTGNGLSSPTSGDLNS